MREDIIDPQKSSFELHPFMCVSLHINKSNLKKCNLILEPVEMTQQLRRAWSQALILGSSQLPVPLAHIHTQASLYT